MKPKGSKKKSREMSLYLRLLRKPVTTLAVCASLYGVLCCFYRFWAQEKSNADPPEALTEIYQLVWLLLLFALVLTAPHTGQMWFVAALVLAGYRVFELSIYALYVVLFGKEIASPERSLLLLVGNLIEVVLAASVFLLNYGCASSWYHALYSGLRTLATIGPEGVNEEGFCRLVLSVQIGVDYFLALVVLALIIGSLRITSKPRS